MYNDESKATCELTLELGFPDKDINCLRIYKYVDIANFKGDCPAEIESAILACIEAICHNNRENILLFILTILNKFLDYGAYENIEKFEQLLENFITNYKKISGKKLKGF